MAADRGGGNNRGFRVLEIIGEESSTSTTTTTTNCHPRGSNQDKLSVETLVSATARAAVPAAICSSPLSGAASSLPDDDNSHGNDLLGLSMFSHNTDTPSSLRCESLS
jgi:hypothetical protein